MSVTIKDIGNLLDQKLKPIKDEQKAIRQEMATKEDLKQFATKDDLAELRKEMATKEDLKNLRDEIIEGVSTTVFDAIRTNAQRIDKLERHTDHPPLVN